MGRKVIRHKVKQRAARRPAGSRRGKRYSATEIFMAVLGAGLLILAGVLVVLSLVD